ncbi:ATP-binding cassette domain-containing protein [Cellulomonas rhizosphaerae]|uniref:ATP-binding cassette domain-containing protein n=1 Tax=Cellulomonas rhizosphaerae TaxID=2293719 RepID=UPI0018F4B2A9|nr:ABC transporter ATP-binding protein [Cellulomonas rhizosphaerae]
MTAHHTLDVVDLRLGYDGPDVVPGLTTIPTGAVTAIIGANASGKSTLLRGMARLLAPRGGRVLLDGASVHAMRSTQVAKVMGLLPRSPVAPDGITVGDLVARGRYPHQGWFRHWTAADDLPRRQLPGRGARPAHRQADVIDADVIAEVFDLRCDVQVDPRSGRPMIVPVGRHHAGVRA